MKKSVKSAVLGAVAKTVLESAKRACGAASRWETVNCEYPL